MGVIDFDLTRAFGQRILAEQHLNGVVSAVYFKCEGDTGYSEYTPGDWDYPVEVHYVDPDGGGRVTTKVYEGLPSIIRVLENIDDDKFD